METIKLICTANQLTGFYIRKTLAFHGLKRLFFWAKGGDTDSFFVEVGAHHILDVIWTELQV